MISRYSAHGLTWVDIESPSKEEVEHIMQEYQIPEILADEMLTSTLHSQVDVYGDLLYLILHLPPSSQNEDRSTDQEIDFIVAKDFIITIHYEKIHSLEKVATFFEKEFTHKNHNAHAGFLFVEMMRETYRHILHKLDTMTQTLDGLEINLFRGSEEQMVKTLSILHRKLLDFKRTLRFHKNVLTSYKESSERLFGKEYGYYAEMIISEFNKVHSIVESNSDTIAELQRTNDSLLSTKQNTIMKRFTILSFVTFPLMLVTGIFGMNTSESILFIQTHADFFFVIGAMVLASATMFTFFKLNRWL
jgi:magnesium transporter